MDILPYTAMVLSKYTHVGRYRTTFTSIDFSIKMRPFIIFTKTGAELSSKAVERKKKF